MFPCLLANLISLPCGPLHKVAQHGSGLPPKQVTQERKRRKVRASDGNHGVFYNLISSDVPFLLGAQIDPDTVWKGTTQGCECEDAGAAGGRLAGWLP